MYLPMTWLKDFIDIDCNVNDFANKMTLSGSKVESIINKGKKICKVVVCKILEINNHPDAEKLLVTKCDIGEKESIQIVTNDKNIFVGALVPVALDGATLFNDIKIKNTKLRGVLSQGMFCSFEELGINKNDYPSASSNQNGVYIFKENYNVGEDIKKIFNLDEDIVEFEITSNRADCFSILGLAREAAATFKNKLKYPKTNLNINKYISKDSVVKINIENFDLCPRYTHAIIKNVKIKSSPQWLKHRLISVGIRPINNIVDITNYVMTEIGQPMHAFNLDKIDGCVMNIRTALNDEKIVTLDGTTRNLDKSMLIISDKNKIVDLAGIMGGENSMIAEGVKTVLLEAANFNSTNIRLTAKKLGLRTDASSKYEKGLDPNLTMLALNKAIELIEELDCGEVSYVHDIYPNPIKKHELYYSSHKINSLLGTSIPEKEMIDLLSLLEIENDGNLLKIPTFRQDIKIEADIAEEVARLYGYDKIEPTLTNRTPTIGKKNKKQNITEIILNTMIFCGLNETLNYSFESPKVFDKLNIDKDSPLRKSIIIQNPLGEDFSIMRTTTLNSMLTSLSTNYNRRNNEAFLFEIGKVYVSKEIPLKELPIEEDVLTIGMYGNIDFYDVKGVFDQLFKNLNLYNEIEYNQSNNISFMHPGRTAEINLFNNNIGFIGELHPQVLENYEINTKAYIGVLNLKNIFENTSFEKKYKPLNKFPAIQRDISIVVKDSILAKNIEKIIRENGGKFLQNINLFDVYKGSQIDEGFKSISYNILFRSNEKTLTDEEINPLMNKILKSLEENLNAQIRK